MPTFAAGPGVPVTFCVIVTVPAEILTVLVPAVVLSVKVAVARPRLSEFIVAGDTEPLPAVILKVTGKLESRLPFFFLSSI